MPKFYCEYCDIQLTHSSPPGRLQHRNGRKHINAVIDWFTNLLREEKLAAPDYLDYLNHPAGPNMNIGISRPPMSVVQERTTRFGVRPPYFMPGPYPEMENQEQPIPSPNMHPGTPSMYPMPMGRPMGQVPPNIGSAQMPMPFMQMPMGMQPSGPGTMPPGGPPMMPNVAGAPIASVMRMTPSMMNPSLPTAHAPINPAAAPGVGTPLPSPGVSPSMPAAAQGVPFCPMLRGINASQVPSNVSPSFLLQNIVQGRASEHNASFSSGPVLNGVAANQPTTNGPAASQESSTATAPSAISRPVVPGPAAQFSQFTSHPSQSEDTPASSTHKSNWGPAR